MLTIDRKRNQSLLLVHKGDQCLIRVLRTAVGSVRFGFEGDEFRFLRGEVSRVSKLGHTLRLLRADNTLIEWGQKGGVLTP